MIERSTSLPVHPMIESAHAFEAARRVIPGGLNSPVRAFRGVGGTPVFAGTRVPVQSLFDYLEAGDTLDEFLRQFPSVQREQAVEALEIARRALLISARPA